MARHGARLLAADDLRVAPGLRGRGHRAGAGAGLLGRLHGGGARSRRRPAARARAALRGLQVAGASHPARPWPRLPRLPRPGALRHHARRQRRARAMDDDRAAPERGRAAVGQLLRRARLRSAVLRPGDDAVLVRAAARRLARDRGGESAVLQLLRLPDELARVARVWGGDRGNHSRVAVPCAERPDARLRRGARGARRVARISAADAAVADPLRELLRQLPRRVCITMTQVKLAELSPSAAPEFVDAASCKAWLEHVPLANVGVAQQQLLGQLVELNRFPISAANRLAVMESLREAVNFVQIEQARRFTNRALPLAEAEAAVFRDTDALWAQMRLSYLRCLDSAASGDAALRAQAALICQRLLACAGLRMFHHYRAYCEIPAEDWRALHGSYAKAEELEVSEEPVKDFLNRDVHDSSPRIAYARAVLMHMSNPNELTQRQLTFIAFLLERWGAKLEVLRDPIDEGDGLPLVADLAGERCPAADAAKVSSDLQAIHYALSGKRFRDPGERRELTPKEREEMETLGRVSKREEAESKDAPGFVLEEWQLEDESAQGLRMVRR